MLNLVFFKVGNFLNEHAQLKNGFCTVAKKLLFFRLSCESAKNIRNKNLVDSEITGKLKGLLEVMDNKC